VRLAPDWRTLPFGTAMFDAIVAASVLEYVRSPTEVLRECARVLRPGGVMLCTVPDPTHPVRWLEWVAGLVARTPAAHAVGRHWLRLGRYLRYLEISRQRRTAGWWSAAAAQAGLFTVPQPPGAVERSSLRLFTFERPTGPGGNP
jgi:SAM-dependent methyltransferase